MKNATVTWKNGLSFTATADTGFSLPLDAESAVGGGDQGFLPMELMAASLAGCTAMDVISILRKKQQDVSGFEVKVQADQAEDFPKVFTHATIRYVVTGHGVEEAAVLRAIELSETKYCPAQAMLGRVVPMDLLYEIYEAETGGSTRLVKQGKYQPKSDRMIK